MKVGDQFLTSSIAIMESSNMEFLFGLDMLRRHQCQIDLAANVLRFTHLDIALPFLQSSELPATAQSVKADQSAPQQCPIISRMVATSEPGFLSEACSTRF